MVFGLLVICAPAWADSTGSPQAASNPPNAPGRGWGSVEKTLGRPGVAQGEGLQIPFPRTDLNVVVQGYPLDSANVLVSWFAFRPGPAGTSKKDSLEGRVYLLDMEVAKALAQAAKGGLEVTALYSPFLDESPSIKCLLLKGQGSRSNLAWAAKGVLSATGTPMDPPAPDPKPTDLPVKADNFPHPNAWGDVQDLLGPGEEKGSTLLYRLEAKDKTASLSFQNHGKDTTALGELAVPEGESKALVEELLQRHVAVTADFSENTGESNQSLVDFWAVGDKKKLAEDLKEILSQEELLNP